MLWLKKEGGWYVKKKTNTLFYTNIEATISTDEMCFLLFVHVRESTCRPLSDSQIDHIILADMDQFFSYRRKCSGFNNNNISTV